jgi:WXG100 family type VII secretion target
MNAKPHRMHEVADAWKQVHTGLSETAQELGTHVNNLLEHWTGQSADAFRAQAQQLHTSLTNGTQYAQNTETAMRNAADALSEAQGAMPSDPSWWDRFSRKMTTESTDVQFRLDAAHYGLNKAIQMDGSQLTANGEAYQKGVVVMETLAGKYNAQTAALQNGAPQRSNTDGVWPAPVAPHPRTVTQPSDSTPASPHQESISTNGPGASGRYKGIGGVNTPGSPNLSGTGGTGISGGVQTTRPSNDTIPITSIDGIHGGVPVPTGNTPVAGVPGGSFQTSGIIGGSPIGGSSVGMFGIGGVSSGALGASEGAGEELSGMSEGETSGLGLGKTGAVGASAEEEGASSERMMGGMGGLGRGSQRKKKRKDRPSYLVEDEETWALDETPSPPVIG